MSTATRAAVLQTFALGRQPFKTFDPFLFCVYHHDTYPAGDESMGPKPSLLAGRDIGSDFSYKDGWSMYHGDIIPGFPSHPHRGFETITVTRQGLIDHSDSMGLTARYGNGDTQWMSAGRGVQHSEMFPLLNRDKPNPAELFQLWLNLPKKSKMSPPSFKMFWKEDTPTLTVPDASGKVTTVTVVAGEIGGVKPLAPPPDSWAADAASDVAVWVLDIPAGGSFALPAGKSTSNRAIYFVQGDTLELTGEAKSFGVRTGLQLDPTASVTLKAGNADAVVLLMHGHPIGEPVVQHGPFVMNTQQEIEQAFADYRRTQFGGWPWPSSAHAHAKNVERHAKHSDGTVEKPKNTAAANHQQKQ